MKHDTPSGLTAAVARSLQRPASKMKPIVGPLGAWFCTILSVFAIVILSFIALMFYKGHEEFVGSVSDPEDGKAVAATIMWAVLVYAIFLVFCGSQVFLIRRNSSVVLS